MWLIKIKSEDKTITAIREYETVKDFVNAVIFFERAKQEFTAYRCEEITSTVTNPA